jgi:hypothetical protein
VIPLANARARSGCQRMPPLPNPPPAFAHAPLFVHAHALTSRTCLHAHPHFSAISPPRCPRLRTPTFQLPPPRLCMPPLHFPPWYLHPCTPPRSLACAPAFVQPPASQPQPSPVHAPAFMHAPASWPPHAAANACSHTRAPPFTMGPANATSQ